MRIVSFRAMGVALACIAMPGCGGNASPELSGNVTYNGAPVESGTVAFTPAGGAGVPFGAKISAGKYTAEKATAGSFVAVVSADSANAGPLTREQAAQQKSATSPNYIPENATGNSQTVEVVIGQPLDFAITGPPRK